MFCPTLEEQREGRENVRRPASPVDTIINFSSVTSFSIGIIAFCKTPTTVSTNTTDHSIHRPCSSPSLSRWPPFFAPLHLLRQPMTSPAATPLHTLMPSLVLAVMAWMLLPSNMRGRLSFRTIASMTKAVARVSPTILTVNAAPGVHQL